VYSCGAVVAVIEANGLFDPPGPPTFEVTGGAGVVP
jgi:hypothetical protein